MIKGHEIFCGIVGARHDYEKLEFIPFVRDEMILVASKKLDLATEISAKQLTDLPFLAREKGSGTRRCLEAHMQKAGINPDNLQTVATLTSTAAVKEAACQNLGVTVLSQLAAKDELRKGNLKQIKINNLPMTRDFYLVHHQQRTMPNHYQAFFQHLQKRDSQPANLSSRSPRR